nr:hypothetical protein [Tanacetum cinerariifolium]
EFAEKPCPKVLTEKEKKRLKAAEKAAAKAAQGGDAPTKDKKVAGKWRAGEGGTSRP